MKVIAHVAIAGILTIMFSACSPSESAKPEATTDLDSVVNKYFQTFNKHDAVELGRFYADSCDMKDPSMGTTMRRIARADIAKKYAEMFSYFKSLNDSVIATYPSGSCITVEFISTGVMPDSTKLYLPICTVFEFSAGKIIKDFTYYNNANE